MLKGVDDPIGQWISSGRGKLPELLETSRLKDSSITMLVLGIIDNGQAKACFIFWRKYGKTI